MAAFLIVFASIHYLSVQFPKQAHTFVHTISFLAQLIVFLEPAFTASRKRQTFEVFGKLLLPEDIPTLLYLQYLQFIYNSRQMQLRHK